jgi:hypothetical protein
MWRHFHDNWFHRLMELPLTRLNTEPDTIFKPPWFYQKNFCFSRFLQ